MNRPLYTVEEITPVEQHGDIFLKRDDLCYIHGASGGKARTCWSLSKNAKNGLATAGSRQSPQVLLVAKMARVLDLPCVAFVPSGKLESGPVFKAIQIGAEVRPVKAGYNTVIVARCREFAKRSGFTEIPFGMQCAEAVKQTRWQVQNVPKQVKRIVVPVGSGMSLAGVLWGMLDYGIKVPVIGVMVGAEPYKRLNEYAPAGWSSMVQLVESGVPYDKQVQARVGDVEVDEIYESKCVKFLQAGDLLWIVGTRK